MKTSFYTKNPKKLLGYLMAFAMVLFSMNVNAQCFNTSAYGSATAVSSGTVTISTCNYLSEYSTLSGIDAASSYTCDIQIGGATVGYVTITEGSASGTVVSHGAAPHTWTSNAAGTYYAHWHVDATCATASGCHTTTITGNAVSVPGCTDPLATNYNPAANVDDGSCTYSGCPLTATAISLPYSGTGLTNCGNGNNVNSGNSAAPNSYWNGEDGIFEFVAANGNDLQVDLTASTSWTGLAVFDGCPTTGGTLVGSSASSSNNESLSFTPVAGNTYYVVVSTWPTPNCIPSFDLSISEIAYGCTDPLATNYNAAATVDDGSCTYPSCSVLGPVCEDFSAGVIPAAACPGGWGVSVTTGSGWIVNSAITPGYAAASNGRPNGTYAWIDFSGTDVGCIMQMDPVDVSAISGSAYLLFDYFSDVGTYTLATANTMFVEAFNGTSWDSVASYTEFTTGWVNKSIDVSAHAVAGVVTLRLRGESSGLSSDYYNDLLVDNICVSSAPVPGCTDATACNYDSTANVNDGSCTFPDVLIH